jgi:hypothetical protein
MHLTFSTFAASFFLIIIKDRNVFSSCLANIEALFIASPASMLSLARAVDRFSAVYSVSARSLP